MFDKHTENRMWGSLVVGIRSLWNSYPLKKQRKLTVFGIDRYVDCMHADTVLFAYKDVGWEDIPFLTDLSRTKMLIAWRPLDTTTHFFHLLRLPFFCRFLLNFLLSTRSFALLFYKCVSYRWPLFWTTDFFMAPEQQLTQDCTECAVSRITPLMLPQSLLPWTWLHFYQELRMLLMLGGEL